VSFDTKILTQGNWGGIMKTQNGEFNKVPQKKEEVEAYLLKLQYALQDENTLIEFQEERYVDLYREKEYTNVYTVAELFPDESPKEAIKRELTNLKVHEYIETVKDRRYPKRSELWVFGRKYGEKDVYIKFRVEIIQRNHIFVLSFHFSTIPFSEIHFPFAK
jgi:quinol monooxygenase YgiN